MSLPRRLSLEGDSLPRRLTEAPDESAAVGRPGMSHGESVQSLPVRLGRNSSEVSQDEFALPRRFATSCTVSEGQGGAMESSGGGSGGGGGGLADSDSSGGVVEAPVVVRRRQSMRLRARVPESEGFSESEGWTTERNKKNKKNCINTEQSLASLPAENNTHRKTNGTKTNLIDETRGKNKRRQTTPLETTPEYHKKTTTTTTTNTERALEEDNDIPASQIPFTNTQRTRRRLMDLEEEITPTQDLITPATPTNKRTGPYHYLLHPQASKTKRKRLSRELFAKKCIDVLTSTTTVPSTSETGATGATTRPTGGSSTNGSSSSTSDAKEHKGSSGDDSVFGEARIVMLPRFRRSTEEFKMVAGRPKPRGSVRGSRGRRSCPPGRFSSSSASGSSASSMCLTSLHSR
ncbi:hypothetical protein E2C01_030360 [Portunus trituberculatus]|uniref:Uncharacterized protein n=1 Tax=Portunus trituberculatus TaxID=210409 RepID=A0A5B7EQN1_PORTR|nr:hypothetical protein [Portunus trituberculatus]